MDTHKIQSPLSKKAIAAYPMHGYFKMVTEGFRTRDAHLLEWISRLMSEDWELTIYSRPEPFPRRALALRGKHITKELRNTREVSPDVLRFPPLRNRHSWWVKSANLYPNPSHANKLLIWNPLLGISEMFGKIDRQTPIHLDLLDDWLIHSSFKSFRKSVYQGYEKLFARATSVTANSEGTLALAHKFGRFDTKLIPNGCDPEAFTIENRAVGPITIGYIGKIGNRVDGDLIERVATNFPEWRFVFAGPVIDRPVAKQISNIANLTMLGDVHYSNIPELLNQFDIGWVPHGVTHGQVGGDAIKIYEYRAAGLPVVTTPIIGTRERPIPGVVVAEAEEHTDVLRDIVQAGNRVNREPMEIPKEFTWRHKAVEILDLLHVSRAPDL